MPHAAGISASFWSWETELAEMLLTPFQPVPRCSQDTELLRQLAFVPGLRELLMLRQVHALEHATVWVLGDRHQRRLHAFSADTARLGGMSTDQGFYLYGPVALNELNQAAHLALQRITAGDWELAIHPRCGTNLSVSALIFMGLSLGSVTLLPRHPLAQIVGIGTAATLTMQLAPHLGDLAQRYLTTAIPFNLGIEQVVAAPNYLGQPAHFVKVRWVD